jgi:uncharacterized damage-inducible protein DinB
MKVRWLMNTWFAIVVSGALACPAAAQIPPGAGEGWLGEFDHASRQLLQLAEAIPAEKYSWRPGPGVRSVSEVFMHLAIANHFLLSQAGAASSFDLKTLGKEPEKSKTAKDEVIAFLKGSFEPVRAGYASADRQKKVKLFGAKEVTADGVFTRILVHNHEHMGQIIAYARMNGVVPPWSKGGGTQ